MPTTETSPDPGSRPGRVDAPASEPVGPDGPGGPAGDTARPGVIELLRDLADDTRTLIEQELELIRLETASSAKRIGIDGAWIWAGAVVITVGLICLALALALGIGALLDSYWLGALVTGGVFLLAGALLAWRGIRDLKSGGLMPGSPLRSLREDRDWARQELEDLKQGITEEP
ncbi:MAG: phage holin family protein [Gemmatimonadota bacterium]